MAYRRSKKLVGLHLFIGGKLRESRNSELADVGVLHISVLLSFIVV